MTLAPLSRMIARLALVAALAFSGPVAAQPKPEANPFADWAVVVAAGDFRAHSEYGCSRSTSSNFLVAALRS